VQLIFDFKVEVQGHRTSKGCRKWRVFRVHICWRPADHELRPRASLIQLGDLGSVTTCHS